MAKMKAAMAAVLVMEKEGITQAFGVPGAAINPVYSALRERQSIRSTLSPSPNPSRNGRAPFANPARCRAPFNKPST
jgi:glyoxylate carboligase